MDFQHRIGSKIGGGGVASSAETNAARRERLRLLALETIDLSKVPFPMMGVLTRAGPVLYEESSWVVRVQALSHAAHQRRKLPCTHAGKKASRQCVSHKAKISLYKFYRKRRAAKEAAEGPQPAMVPSLIGNAHHSFQTKHRVEIKKFVKIGRPGYRGTELNVEIFFI